VKHVDVLATRGTQRLYAEAKGRTASVGLDVDTLYGQLLHRMPREALGAAIFAGVIPDKHRITRFSFGSLPAKPLKDVGCHRG
jgi:hypothetical protein